MLLDYKKQIQELIVSLMADEITAATIYVELANDVKMVGLSKELLQHANEEFSHYVKLINYAKAHGIKVQDGYKFVESDLLEAPRRGTTEEIMAYVQKLEKIAIDRYKNASLFARKSDDLETEEFFKEIMEEEIAHFDDLANINNDTRVIGEKSKNKISSFSDFLHVL